MEIKYNANIDAESVRKNLHRILNQTYKLLPNREEGKDWEKPLSTLIEELAGMDEILINHHDTLFPLLCKMEGLLKLQEKKDFFLYRRTIFECLELLGDIMQQCQD